MPADHKIATDERLAKAAVLSEALPFMRRHAGKTVVVKYGGHAMGDATLSSAFARDMVLLKQVGINPVVVHGGGPQIGQMLDRLRIKSNFIDGLRVSDRETVGIVEMVLCGSINKAIVSSINAVGGTAIGLSGKDGDLITVERLRRSRRDPDSNIEQVHDLGFVGQPKEVNADLLATLTQSNIIPVIAPIGIGDDGETYNINADTAAGAVAGALGATRLLMLTDVAGVLDGSGELIIDMAVNEAQRLIADGTISGGMIPKVETCIDAVQHSAAGAVIMDGRTPHAVLLEIFTEHGQGTAIWPAAKWPAAQ